LYSWGCGKKGVSFEATQKNSKPKAKQRTEKILEIRWAQRGAPRFRFVIKKSGGGKEMSKSTLNEAKYKNALLYFMSYCNNQWLGQTKLNKLMYYLVFISYRDRGESVSGDVYLHEAYGPVPKNIDDVLLDLKQNKKMQAEDIAYGTSNKKVFEAKEAPDLSVFNEYEQKLLETICSRFRSWSTAKIVEQTHFESPCLYSEPWEVVDYGYAHDIEIISEDEFAEVSTTSSASTAHA
jgi:uncharacterized phage-associated protein